FRQLRLVECIERSVPKGDEPQLDRAARVLQEIIEERGLQDATLYTALPGDQLSLRLLTLPFADPRKIEQVVGFELESQILSPIEDVIYDHRVVDHTEPGGARVMAAAADKDIARAQLERTARSGVEARALFAAPLVYDALALRFLPDETGIFAIVDVGAEHTNVAVIRGGVVAVARTISRGGAELTRALERTYRLAEDAAERVKSEHGFAPYT